MVNVTDFPDDENGNVLRRMVESGDDLTRSRIIEFNVVFPDARSARLFKEKLIVSQLKGVEIEKGNVVPGFSWDAMVSIEMTPTHDGIAFVEKVLQDFAGNFGGINDGWGCLQSS